MQEIYLRYKEAQVYRDGSSANVEFEHMGVKFIQYDHQFGNSQSNIADERGFCCHLVRLTRSVNSMHQRI